MVSGSLSLGQDQLEQLLSGRVDEAELRLVLAGQDWVQRGDGAGWGLHALAQRVRGCSPRAVPVARDLI